MINTIIRVALFLVIVGLSYFLYTSITEPWEAEEQKKELTRLTRERMIDIRTAMTRFEAERDSFPRLFASLESYLREDSIVVANPDTFFSPSFQIDSLGYSPRTGAAFVLQVNDTSRVDMYLLQDPDSDDYIGALQPDPTKLNAASWE